MKPAPRTYEEWRDRSDLTSRYEGKHVAWHRRSHTIVGSADSLDDLSHQLTSNGYKLDSVDFGFVPVPGAVPIVL